MSVIIARIALVLVIGAAALWLALGGAALNAGRIAEWMRTLGAWAPALHVLLFALGTVLFVPGSLFVWPAAPYSGQRWERSSISPVRRSAQWPHF